MKGKKGSSKGPNKASITNNNLPASDISSMSGSIFDGIKFIRLSQWKECGRSTVLAGGVSCAGQIFRRFELKVDSNVVLEFWFRGAPMSNASASNFSELLLDLGDVTEEELGSVEEVWRGSIGAYLRRVQPIPSRSHCTLMQPRLEN